MHQRHFDRNREGSGNYPSLFHVGGRTLMRRMMVPALSLFLAGCASAPTHVYTLTSISPDRQIAITALRVPIEVGDIPVPAAIDRSSLGLDEVNGQLSISPGDIWAAPLSSLIRQTVTTDLQFRLGVGNVFPPGFIAPNGRLRVLALTIEQFMGSTRGRVVLNVSWALLDAGTSHVALSGHELITVQAASSKIADIVSAMSQALGQLADRIAQRIVA
jgi:uncharacterized lipoprotein YmbA